MEDFEELRAEQEIGDHVGNDDEANGHISDIVSPIGWQKNSVPTVLSYTA